MIPWQRFILFWKCVKQNLAFVTHLPNTFLWINLQWPSKDVKYLQFNPSKPNKFHIKLFVVSEHLSGYISGFSVYTGKTCSELVAVNANLDLYCSVTTKMVMGLLQKTKLLDNR